MLLMANDKFVLSTVAVPCSFCNATGKDPFEIMSRLSDCPVCIGCGVISVPGPGVRCAHCRGTGAIRRLTCTVCRGRGVVSAPTKPTKVCSDCGGTGDDASNGAMYCLSCRGMGWVGTQQNEDEAQLTTNSVRSLRR